MIRTTTTPKVTVLIAVGRLLRAQGKDSEHLRRRKAMATGAKKTGTKPTDEKIIEVKKEDDGNSNEENRPKDEDDAPKGQKDKSLKMKTGTGKKSGSYAYDDTPLPVEDVDESVNEDDDAEDQRPGEKAR